MPKRKRAEQLAGDKLKAAEVAKGSKGRKPANASQSTDGTPSEGHIAWYREWTVRFRSIRSIAADSGAAPSVVHRAVHKVALWVRLELFDDIVEHRHRHTEQLEHVASEALQAWEKSKEIGVVETVETEDSAVEGVSVAKKKKRQEKHQTGDSSYLGEVRSALAEIREIWGVNMPTKLEVTPGDSEGLERVAGKDRVQALADQAAALVQMSATLKEAIEGEV